jgi:hypothetical protein
MAIKTADGVAFDIHVKGNRTGKTWAGAFRAKTVLPFRDRIARDKYRRELLGPDAHNADPEVVAQAVIISELSVRLVEAPEWWKEKRGGLDLADENVLQEVYQAALKVEDDALAAIDAEGSEAVEQLRGMKAEEKKK